jgi:hypothetical protein
MQFNDNVDLVNREKEKKKIINEKTTEECFTNVSVKSKMTQVKTKTSSVQSSTTEGILAQNITKCGPRDEGEMGEMEKRVLKTIVENREYDKRICTKVCCASEK